MNDPVILIWISLICFFGAIVAACWRRDTAPYYSASIAMVAGGLFFYVLYGYLKHG